MALKRQHLEDSSSVAAVVATSVMRSNERFWHPEEFKGSQGAVLKALERLTAEGELRHVRRGLYWRGSPTALGMSGPSAVQIVFELVGSIGVGPAEWSASLALGLSTQHPRHDVFAVPRRPPRQFDRHLEFRDRSGREGRRRSRLNWWEVAVLEVLDDWSKWIELNRDEAADRITQLLLSDEIRPGKLATAADGEPAVVRESLRNLMSAAGLDSEAQRIPPARSAGPRAHALAA